MPETQIGTYLRARRELVRPEDVGISDLGRRRVPGLRRSELAMLAGISSEYLIRLEQGRNERPSPQVLDALARALQLDEDATAHLHALVRAVDAGSPPRRRPRRPETVPASIEHLIGTWHATPAYVEGRLTDVLASNPLARAVSPLFTPGVNLVRAVFLDPAIEDITDDWEATAHGAAATLRARVGPDVSDPELTELVGELSVRSKTFRRLWARHDVHPHPARGVRAFTHPQVGSMALRWDKLQIPETGGQTLVIHHAEPGSASEDALALLASLAAAG